MTDLRKTSTPPPPPPPPGRDRHLASSTEAVMRSRLAALDAAVRLGASGNAVHRHVRAQVLKDAEAFEAWLLREVPRG